MFLLTGFTSRLRLVGILMASLSAAGMTQAQPAQSNGTTGIYSCVDARGRKLTSDRPIVECIDREQKILNPSGTVRAKVGPSLTAKERDDLEAKQKVELEEQAHRNEEKRRDRALLTRYPNKTVHDKERAEALAQIRVVREASMHRLQELLRQRAAIDTEMEFYKKAPDRAPPPVLRQRDEVDHSIGVQVGFIADQDDELKRVNARFDEELVRLKRLWLLNSPTPRSDTGKAR